MDKRGSLTIVGTGIKALSQLTREGRFTVENAETVLYGVSDPVTAKWIRDSHPDAESLDTEYRDGEPRRATYEAMVDRILSRVREGKRVCICFEGHPGVLVYASHEAVRRARAEGYDARMLPGISTLDSLFADLGVDPAERGLQTFEATDFLLFRRRVDASVPLVLWQIDCLGDIAFRRDGYSRRHWVLLSKALGAVYGDDHEVFIYQAAILPIAKPVIERTRLDLLAETSLRGFTLYVPARLDRPLDADALARLGIA